MNRTLTLVAIVAALVVVGVVLTRKPATAGHRPVVAVMPKSKGNAYFITCRSGAEEAAKELGVDLLWDGPTGPDPAEQNRIVDTWITRKVDVIAASVENRDGLSSVLKKARAAGIPVITWDADTTPDARSLFVNQATPEGIGQVLMDHTGRILGGKGRFAIITASLTAGNMVAWQQAVEARRAANWPGIELATIRACDDLQKKAFDETNAVLGAMPDVKVILCLCVPAVPGAAEAVEQSGRTDVKVVGLGLPNDNKSFVKKGITEAVVLWNTTDLGYLTVHAAAAVAAGRLATGSATFAAGRLGTLMVAGDNLLLGLPYTFDKTNIDRFDF
ncbi:rhamnose ABC transporter substrate-binding protein [Planctomycetota bacterium]|nr:rhamnose ABC transporter substrate-binding protein [Planctomycetota bacterium]